MSDNKDIILGCMGLGGGWNRESISNHDEKVAQEAVETAIEIGIHKMDHADIYTFGKAEEVFGRVLKSNPGLREKLVIQSKAGIMLGEGINGSNVYNNSKEYLKQQVHTSLKKLQTDYLDVFLIHRPDPLMNGEEVAETFNELKESGLVRSFGVSNMSLNQIQYIQKYWDEPLVANQIQFSLGQSSLIDIGVNVNTRNVNHETGLQGLLEYSKTSNLTIQAWGSLDQGRYSGKEANEKSASEQQTITLVKELSEKYDVAPSAIVLAWTLSLPISVHPIIGTTNPERIRECQKALTVQLTRKEWYDLWIAAKGVSLP